MKIVVVDDVEDIATILTHLLKRHGHEVIFCHDSTQAPDLIIENNPEVVLSDLSMPNLTGVEVFHKLKNKWKGVFIILTGDTTTNVEEIYNIGINRVLFKPGDLTRIISVLDEFAFPSS